MAKLNGQRRHTGTYLYRDPDTGVVAYRKLRYEFGDGEKTFIFDPKGRGGYPPLLYGGESLNDGPIWIVEGEKCVDRIRALGGTAVCTDSGAESKWLLSHGELLSGWTIVLWPDSDAIGEKYIANAARAICAADPEPDIRVVRPLPINGGHGLDVCDWTGDLAELAAGAEAYSTADAPTDLDGPSPLKIYSASDFANSPPPEREWLVPSVVLMYRVTLLSGNGGEGKSLLALQLSVAVAAGGGWIGKETRRGKVLHLSCEDDRDESHRRIWDIIHGGKNIDLKALGALQIVDLVGEDALLAVPNKTGMATTARFAQIEKLVAETMPVLAVVDTLADVNGGDENVRAQVSQFVGFLTGLAIKYRAAIILLAHPSLSGMASGSGTSGSTGWNNTVRGRCYLKPFPKKEGDEDTTLKQLEIMKSNYGPKGEVIPLQWQAGRFVVSGPLPLPEQMAADEAREDGLMKNMKTWNSQGRYVSDRPGSNYAPVVFARADPTFTVKEYEAAMNRLFKSGKIAIELAGPPSRQTRRIVSTAEDG